MPIRRLIADVRRVPVLPSPATLWPDDLECSGQIARADVAPFGYAGWMFLSGDTGAWRQELRMPLIQEALAQKMNAPVDVIIIGVCSFRQRSVEQTSYSAAEILTQ